MKQGGWSFKEFLFILAIIFITLLILVVLIRGSIKTITKSNNKNNNKNKNQTVEVKTISYDSLEAKIKRAAERYQNDNYQGNLESTETYILKDEFLIKKGYLDSKLKDPNNSKTKCDGYVVFDKNQAKITYKPYIKCANNYQTAGYDKSLN